MAAAQAAAARRAEPRPGADGGRRGVPADRRAQAGRHDDPAGRAECPCRARDRRRGYVIETGRLVLEDSGAKLLANVRVPRAYLGV
ncbi:MAG: hypothetical protein WDO24_24480 [Pseudomonadota bacterium]